MAIEMNNRTKILAGVVVLVVLAAGAWFFLFDESAPPPKTVTVSKTSKASKADAAKPSAAAPKQADAAKKPADAPKPAAAPAAAPSAAVQPAPGKPIPTNPEKLIAEVVETSGLPSAFQAAGVEFARQASTGDQDPGLSADEMRAVTDAVTKAFEPAQMSAEVRANLKANFDDERMARFLEILRQPIALKMTSAELHAVAPTEAMKEFSENLRKNPPAPARTKLLRALDDVTRSSEVQAEMADAMVREMLDTVLAELRKAGKKVPKESSQAVATQLNAVRAQARNHAVGMLHFTYRNTSDEDLSAYIKLLDTDTGRWGTEQLTNALRPVLASRSGAVGKEIAPLVLSRRAGAAARAPAQPIEEPLAKAHPEAVEETPAAGTAAAPAEPVGYRRPANIRDLYSRYNDLMTATVMGDGAAVKELLDDGKDPNQRQSDGLTPLMVAAGGNDLAIATLLLSKGADPNLRAAGGVNALAIAKARGTAGAAMAQLLQRSGARE